MKLNKTPRYWSSPLLVALLVVLAGCVTKRIVWSPDGKQAAVLGEKGLYLCDEEGKLSELLVPDVALAEWFPDSRRLALMRAVKVKTWSDLQPLLAPEARERIVRGVQIAKQELEAGRELSQVLDAPKDLTSEERSAMGIYLRGLEGVRQKVGANWNFLESIELDQSILLVGTVTNGTVELGAPLNSSLRKIFDLRIAPGGTMIAYATDPGEKHEGTLEVVPVDGSRPPQLVAERAALYSDWSRDGRSLVYIKCAGVAESKDQVMLGSLTRRGVLDEAGRVALQERPEEIAGLFFDDYSRVRCLSDGRIVFSALEVRLPCTTADMPQRQQLFVLDPEKQATLTRLIPSSAQSSIPETANFFDVSPDGKFVAVLGEKNEVVVLTLATGNVQTLQRSTESVGSPSLPTWRSTNELCFISVPTTNNVAQPAQIVLWEAGKTRTLSSTWPPEVRKAFLDNK
jgi:hypothetical protein